MTNQGKDDIAEIVRGLRKFGYNQTNNNRAVDLIERLTARPAQEPVAWQYRWLHGDWTRWIALDDQSLDDFKRINARSLANGTTELRPLYAYALTGENEK